MRRVDVGASVSGDDGAAMSATVTYPTTEGGPFAVAAPSLGSIGDLRVDGNPRQAGGATAAVDPRAEKAVVSWIVRGVVERYADGAIVTLPVWTAPTGANGDDARIPLHAVVTLPAAPTGAVHWHGASPATVVVDGTTVTLDGEVGLATSSELTFVLPSDAVAQTPVLAGTTRVAGFVSRQSAADASDAQRAGDLRSDRRREDVIAAGYWGVVALEIAIPFLVVLLAATRTAKVRLRARRGVPEEIDEPPSDLAPALVALLHHEGHDIGTEAIAGTVLDLVRRGALRMESISSEHYLLSVASPGETPAEQELLSALSAAATPDGTIAGPPLSIDAKGPWWPATRREVAAQARRQGLIRRRYPSGLFLTSVVALGLTTIPLYARSPEALVAGLVVAAVLAALPFVGGYVLTADGHRERARWEAFRRRLVGQGDLGDVGAAGHVVWGPYLIYGAALGVAVAAVADLTPRGARPKEPVAP
ncbi:MAG: hypothetical protein ABIV94_03380 [Acidimicrobiales bacterium]